MRIMLDTNVLISMALFPSRRFGEMLDFITREHTLVLSSFVVEELEEVTERKFPSKKDAIDRFLTKLSYEMVYTPHRMKGGLFEIRDIKDYPTENDVLGGGFPMYHIDRTIREMNHESFGDGSHIIYVNGAYMDESDQIGKLMHDFRCTSAADMYFEILADRVRYFKETEGGRAQVCKMVEDLTRESAVLASIEAWREDDIPEAEILRRIMNKYDLNRTEADAYMAKSKKSA
ncbi:MAG: PIN domain-containing protein [Clostridiales bacterium]|nr:PIN domain-containing protein [Clostridiales bacterium]